MGGVAAYAIALSIGSRGVGSGSGPEGPAEIDLLPSPGTRSSCIVDILGEPRPTLALDNGTFQANTYDVPSGTSGHVGMCYNATSGSMFSYANWTKVGTGGGWFSYPQVAYGVNEYDGSRTTYTNQSPAWTLPQSVASTVNESLWVTSEYAVRAPSPADVDGYDLSLDDFFSSGPWPEFEVGPFVEVEIFLAHNISYPFHWAHWSAPTLVNSTVSVEPWDVAYWCHGTDNGSSANISFDFSYDGQATHGLSVGVLGVNLSAMLVEVEDLMPQASCWTGPLDHFSQLHLDEEVLGSEDGALGGASFNYNWTVSLYCLHTRVATPTLAGLGCRSVSAAKVLPEGPAPGSGTASTPALGPSVPRSAPRGRSGR